MGPIFGRWERLCWGCGCARRTGAVPGVLKARLRKQNLWRRHGQALRRGLLCWGPLGGEESSPGSGGALGTALEQSTQSSLLLSDQDHHIPPTALSWNPPVLGSPRMGTNPALSLCASPSHNSTYSHPATSSCPPCRAPWPRSRFTSWGGGGPEAPIPLSAARQSCLHPPAVSRGTARGSGRGLGCFSLPVISLIAHLFSAISPRCLLLSA